MNLFETTRQLPLFAVCICSGAILGIIYDIFYLFRRRRKGILLHVSDALFSLVFFLLTSLTVQLFNSGKLEIYLLLGIFLGFCIERATLGNFIKFSIDFFIKILYNLCVRFKVSERLKRMLK
jgi:hypothetical protein